MEQDDHQKIDEILKTVKLLKVLSESQDKKIDILDERLSNLSDNL